jgi:hypothetical protein
MPRPAFEAHGRRPGRTSHSRPPRGPAGARVPEERFHIPEGCDTSHEDGRHERHPKHRDATPWGSAAQLESSTTAVVDRAAASPFLPFPDAAPAVHAEDRWDAVHQAAGEQVEAFLDAMLETAGADEKILRRHADNAYVFVEFLANTYPKMPREATERDVWLFLFDYYLTAGPFAGAVAELAPVSTRLFFDFLARRERVRELDYIRAACAMEDYFAARKREYEHLAKRGATGGEVQEWYADLDAKMRERGLTPDASLAGGEEQWGVHMGPLEAAVFDALCLLLSTRAREMAPRRPSPEALETALLEAQRKFMMTRNEQLKATPLQAIVRERKAMAEQGFDVG